jgi:hypothetical protein
MVTGVWQLLKKMAGGNLSLPETNCGASLMLSGVAEPASAPNSSKFQIL